MNSKEIQENEKDFTNPEFADLFESSSQEDEIRHEARVIMYRFMSEVERLIDEKNINKKELASLIGTSPSYITQLFKGNKLLNLETAAKFQRAFNIKFDIKAYPKDAIIKDKIIYTTTIIVAEGNQYTYNYNAYGDYHGYSPIYETLQPTQFHLRVTKGE